MGRLAIIMAMMTAASLAAEPIDKPNIVLIFIDDMGYGDIGPFGNQVNHTPSLDRMAKEGNVLRQFYVANTNCTPSRAALMTGTYASRIGMDGDVLFPGEERGLNPEEVTIADMLKARGYATGCFGKWHLGDQLEFLPLAQGFDEYFGIPYSNDMWPGNLKGHRHTKQPYTPLPVLRQNQVVAYVSDGADQSLLCEAVTNAAVQFIEDHQDEPFFCYVPHAYVHRPRFARPDVLAKASGDVDRANVEEVDTSVGRILDTLRELKLDKKTLVIFTSDNGGASGMTMGPLRGGKGGPKYEGHMREPTITWWPGTIPSGVVSNGIAVATDLLPSLARLTGARVPDDRVIDGKDVLDILLGKSTAKSPHDVHYYEVDGIRRGPWKLVRKGQKRELYRLDKDLGERKDLAKRRPEIVAELDALLDAHAAAIAKKTRPAGFVKPGTAKALITVPGDLPRLRDFMGLPDTVAGEPVLKQKVQKKQKPRQVKSGERLYNGIRLPAVWPPRSFAFGARLPSPPYLKAIQDVIPIDVGRQLFVDDFLIESITLKRRFHRPDKYSGNPVLKPVTALEMNRGFCPVAAPFSDGAFYDPTDDRFKLWYHAGWFDGVALAVSRDGLQWTRPKFDVVSGSNRVVAPRDDLRRDGVSVWLDHDARNPEERFKMFHYARTGKIGDKLKKGNGYLLTSADGIHWNWRGKTGETRDNTTFFYNPFRKVWAFSHRAKMGEARVRHYWEHKNFLAALGEWDDYDPVFWAKADALDRPDPKIQEAPQLYKIDAVAYESLMIGLFQIHLGPPNAVCAKKGRSKLTDLKIAFSRDGFHWDRSHRDSFISASQRAGDWERAYVTPAGGVCLVVGDKLHFYYGAFQGEETKLNPIGFWNGMYANASTGLAILRRDGFASLDAGVHSGTVTTRPVTFKGKYLYVNVDCPDGMLTAEILGEDGHVIPPFTVDNCVPILCDETLAAVTWKDAGDLAGLVGKPVRFRFHLTNGSLYSFWVSPDQSGASHGYVAAGGPGFTGPTDTIGRGERLEFNRRP